MLAGMNETLSPVLGNDARFCPVSSLYNTRPGSLGGHQKSGAMG